MAAEKRKPRTAPLKVEVSNLYEPIADIRRALERHCPASGLLGVGIGMRRRQGQLRREPVVKLLVRAKSVKNRGEKPKPLPARKRLPRRLVLVSRVLGRSIKIPVATDIEEVASAKATVYRVTPGTGGNLSVCAYALWTDGTGRKRIGLVTAGHGLWKSPAHANPVASAQVELGGGMQRLKVRCTSHLGRDGLDVGLLVFPPGDAVSVADGLKTIWSQVRFVTAAEVASALGNSADTLGIETIFRFPGRRARCSSVAYFDEFPVNVQNWGPVTMKQTVESTGVANTFVAGSSGSAIVGQNDPHVALGIQSLSLDPPAARHSLATSFDGALAWLRAQVSPGLELYWNKDRLRTAAGT